MGGDALQAAVDDIRSMRVRGATALASAAAGALAAHLATRGGSAGDVLAEARRAARLLDAARPTAVTLHNALGAVLAAVQAAQGADARRQAAAQAARAVAREMEAARAAIAAHGARHLREDATVLTHCHSSTAVAVLAAAQREGKRPQVVATETRPFRQGLRTARALREAGVDTTLVVDAAAEHVLATRRVDAVLVGADTVCGDGTLVNKVGTAGIAALARLHGVPLLCAAGRHRFTPRGPAGVPIEERPAEEVAAPGELAPGTRVFNPVFDRTPPAHVTAYVTEAGLAAPAEAVARNLAALPPEGAWG